MKIENLDKVNSLYNFYQVKKNDYENLKKAIKDKECFTLESESIYQTTSFKLTDNEVDIILKRLNSELEEIIKKLENLGVEIESKNGMQIMF